ncbi:predicted protein [Chaetoceros tenuissimus]|uniref:Uncharacterized protein n=1 Tax=Chaetoceros tenuissimus TaxID=426638 RepID=A0AAD3HF36_9STRA|nr:predicted protein [Chaetoceros tenuissimus]
MTIQGQEEEEKKFLLKHCGGRGAYLWNSQELSHAIKTLTATPTSNSTPTDTSQTCSKEDLKQMISSLLRNRGIFHPRPMAGQKRKRRKEETLFPHVISEIMSLVKDTENEQQVNIEEDMITQLIVDVVQDRHFTKTSHRCYQEREQRVKDPKESCSNEDGGNDGYFTTPSAITKRVYAQVIYKHLTCNDVKVENAIDEDGSRHHILSTATHQFLDKLGKLAELEIDAFEVYLLLHLESIEMNSRLGNIGDATIAIEKDETDVDARQKAFHKTMSSAIVDIVDAHPDVVCKLPCELILILAQKDFAFAKVVSKAIMRCIVEYSAMIPRYTCEQVESGNKRKRSRNARDDPFKMLEKCRTLYLEWNGASADMKDLLNMQVKVLIDEVEPNQLVALRDFITSCRDEK